MDPLVVLDRVNKHFGEQHVLKDISLTVSRGEVVVVIGPSGSGKSTLCRTINRLETIDSGSITIDGRALPAEGAALARLRADVGMVFQSFNLFAHKTVLQNVTLGQTVVRRRSAADATRRAMELLDRVGVANQAGKMPAQLSGGQQQRIRIGQALAADPTLLLCDEPFGSLDMGQQREIAELIDRRRREHHTAVLLVTHDVNPIIEHVDRVLYLAGGSFRIGSVAEVLRSDVLTQLYGTPIEVVRVGERLAVVGTGEDPHEHGRVHHHG